MYSELRRLTVHGQYRWINWMMLLLFPLFVAYLASMYNGWPMSSGSALASCLTLLIVLAPLAFFVLAAISHRCMSQLHGSFEHPGSCTSWSGDVHEGEWEACLSRRTLAKVDAAQQYCALSLAGGGIRQANFAVGVILYLTSRPASATCRPMWSNVDFISAVSGGGYAAISVVTHSLMQPARGDFDAESRHAAVRSAGLLQAHANWPMERNWPARLDCIMRHCSCFGVVLNILFLVTFGVVQFLTPFVFLWSICVLLIPLVLTVSIDLPSRTSGMDCQNWSTWWLAPGDEENRRDVLSIAAMLLIGLRVIRSVLAGRAARIQKTINIALRSDSFVDSEDKNRLIVKHARVIAAMHLARALFSLLAFAWLLSAAFVIAGYNCGTFFDSKVKNLDLSLLGSAAILIIVSQSQSISGGTPIELPATLLCLGTALLYSFGCVYFQAWMMGSGCATECVPRLAARFFNRKAFYFALAIWGLQPLLHNFWTFLLPRWYTWKLSRFLPDAWLTLQDLRESIAKAPYLLMCSTVHHVWRLPRDDGMLEQRRSSTFIMSPLFVGDDAVGFVDTRNSPHNALRVAGAAAVSGAATANHIGERTAPMHHLLTFFSGLVFGCWLQFEPDVAPFESLSTVFAMLAVLLLHLAGTVATLMGFEKCTSADPGTSAEWSCTDEGRAYVFAGFALIVLEVFVIPVFMTWATAIWRAPLLGKWLSEWMQLQGFCFPHGAVSAGGLPRHVYLSDGGHTDNLGVIEPLRRRSRIIICAHAGFTNTHAMNNLGNALRRAQEDPSIHADFVPLRWDGTRLVRVPGNLDKARAEFALDMTKNCFLVGINYAPYMDGSSNGPPPMRNTWGVIALLVNRPAAEKACTSWGLKCPDADCVSQVDRGLAEWDQFCTAEGLCQGVGAETWDPGPSSLSALHRRAGVGVCCPCCHRWPPHLRGLLEPFGTFPNHSTPVQCLTPETAEAYQALGFAVAAMNADLLRHLAGELESDIHRCSFDESRRWL